MTAIMVHPILYRCDGARCSAEVLGHSGALPPGWIEDPIGHPNEPDYHLGHLCPKCKPPEGRP